MVRWSGEGWVRERHGVAAGSAAPDDEAEGIPPEEFLSGVGEKTHPDKDENAKTIQ
jgi:hypothetical protein